tara:strand:- start:609 stop:833 length:225 start_codon:yes stop_codon:yes gene_type:complete
VGKDLFEGRFLTIFRQAYLLGRPIFLGADGEPPGSSTTDVRRWVLGPTLNSFVYSTNRAMVALKVQIKKKKSSF